MRQEIFEAQGSSAGDPLPGDAQLTAKIQHMALFMGGDDHREDVGGGSYHNDVWSTLGAGKQAFSPQTILHMIVIFFRL
jgi:hypothetical protein